MEISRRRLITGLVSFVAAPAIVRASSLMPVKAWVPRLGYPTMIMRDVWAYEGAYDAFPEFIGIKAGDAIFVTSDGETRLFHVAESDLWGSATIS